MSRGCSGIRLTAAGERVGSALPGTGPVVWKLKVRASSSAAYGSLLAATTRNGFTAVGNIDTFAKLAMTDPGVRF
jgi:hypothetical protein